MSESEIKKSGDLLIKSWEKLVDEGKIKVTPDEADAVVFHELRKQNVAPKLHDWKKLSHGFEQCRVCGEMLLDNGLNDDSDCRGPKEHTFTPQEHDWLSRGQVETYMRAHELEKHPEHEIYQICKQACQYDDRRRKDG